MASWQTSSAPLRHRQWSTSGTSQGCSRCPSRIGCDRNRRGRSVQPHTGCSRCIPCRGPASRNFRHSGSSDAVTRTKPAATDSKRKAHSSASPPLKISWTISEPPAQPQLRKVGSCTTQNAATAAYSWNRWLFLVRPVRNCHDHFVPSWPGCKDSPQAPQSAEPGAGDRRDPLQAGRCRLGPAGHPRHLRRRGDPRDSRALSSNWS